MNCKIRLPLFTALTITLLAAGCKSSGGNTEALDDIPAEITYYNNPPADGFNIEGSSPIAVLLADQVMNAMGGRARWDSTNVIYWNFFGARQLLWDKANNRVRIDIPSQKTVIALNMNDMSGSVWKDGEKMEHPDSVAEYLQDGHYYWINDSYWLVMPFKLKDSGVTLSYLDEDTTIAGERADVLRLTFENVGVTPQNAYHVWVNIDDKLVKQWAWFNNASQEEPNFIRPWTDYKSYNGLLLSGERGDRDLTDIKVMDAAPEGAFVSPEPLAF